MKYGICASSVCQKVNQNQKLKVELEILKHFIFPFLFRNSKADIAQNLLEKTHIRKQLFSTSKISGFKVAEKQEAEPAQEEPVTPVKKTEMASGDFRSVKVMGLLICSCILNLEKSILDPRRLVF